nr:hypothetical protein [Allomuricauda sp.]
MGKLTLHKVSRSENGREIHYSYEVSKDIEKYFRLDNPYYIKYDRNISTAPLGLQVIPFLSNVMPMSWFVGFDVYMDECDETFFESLQILKKQFHEFFPNNVKKSELHVKSLIRNEIKGTNTSLLFSGGLDSYDSLIRNIDKNPYLISVHGADVEIADTDRWNKFVQFNSEERIIDHGRLFYVESNLREFYTYRVDLLTDLGWWGGIQHGMALLGVLAPLSYTFGITDIRIAASATYEVSYSWGSSPKIDENMRWANTKVTHDGYDQRRTDKVDNVVAFVDQNKENIKLRVCFAEERSGHNCNHCHKCQRTILSLILSNANPADYGFVVPDNLYEMLFSNFNENAVMTVGIKYQWTCLQDKAREGGAFFVLDDYDREKEYLERFAHLDLDSIVNKNEQQVKQRKRTRLILREKLPFIYKIYQKLRA